MKKIYSTLVLSIVLFSFQSQAQISAGVGCGIISGSEEIFGYYWGAELYGKYDLNDNLRAGINIGFYRDSYNSESFSESFKTVRKAIPISFLGEYRFLEGKFRPYAGGHLGLMRSVVRNNISETREMFVSFSPVAGIDYRLLGSFNLNFNLKYSFCYFRNQVSGKLENFSVFSPNIGVFYQF